MLRVDQPLKEVATVRIETMNMKWSVVEKWNERDSFRIARFDSKEDAELFIGALEASPEKTVTLILCVNGQPYKATPTLEADHD